MSELGELLEVVRRAHRSFSGVRPLLDPRPVVAGLELVAAGATERHGRALTLSVGPWRRVLLEERGTFVELDSQTVETDALVELALALEPAATEPPPLLA